MASESSPTRRSVLRNLLFVSAGISLMVLGATSVLGSSSSKEDPESITIKVVYVGMSTKMSGIKEEYLVLPSTAHLDDALAQLKQEHSVLSAMLPAMQIVVNGVPTQSNPILQDQTEIDMIPIFAGG